MLNLTMGYIVDAIQVSISFFVIQVLTTSFDDFYGIFLKKQRHTGPEIEWFFLYKFFKIIE